MQAIVCANPFRCRVWHLHDRLEEHISEQSCAAEIKSFEDHGQLVPALARRLNGDPDYDFELIYGARRLFVARYLNKALTVELRELSDRDGIIAMDMENRQRKDISPYERGISYARWLRAGYFQSQDDLSRALNISASQVSRLLKLARLPSVIVDAFGAATDICEGWGGDLVDALEDSQKRRSLIRTAREISAAPRPPAREVYRLLLASYAAGRKPKSAAHDEVVIGEDGEPLFRIRRQVGTIALILPITRVSARSLENIQRAVAQILQKSSTRSDTLPTVRDARLSGEADHLRVMPS
jgi:ParB family transcriptional regulator, chromosome partitioning protein